MEAENGWRRLKKGGGGWKRAAGAQNGWKLAVGPENERCGFINRLPSCTASVMRQTVVVVQTSDGTSKWLIVGESITKIMKKKKG